MPAKFQVGQKVVIQAEGNTDYEQHTPPQKMVGGVGYVESYLPIMVKTGGTSQASEFFPSDGTLEITLYVYVVRLGTERLKLEESWLEAV